MNTLEMRKTRKYDSGKVRVTARNSLGEVDSSTTLTVNPLEDLRSNLRPTSRRKATVESKHRSLFSGNIFVVLKFEYRINVPKSKY